MNQPLDPEALLDLAKELAASQNTSAQRTAADRAYYAAFLFARDQLASKRYITPYYGPNDHGYVADQLGRLFGAAAGNEEQRLRERRNRLTYDTRRIPASFTLNWMLETAEHLMRQVKSLPARQ